MLKLNNFNRILIRINSYLTDWLCNIIVLKISMRQMRELLICYIALNPDQ